MNRTDWWEQQFVEIIKELTCTYEKFCSSRNIDFLDEAEQLSEQLNDAYKLALDLEDFIELGRALLSRQAPPDNK
jgi:hypothetical protein